MVFSVDYRLSPNNRFPDALNDCWQVYVWLLEQGEKHLGFPIKEIVLAGDSAGGNLIASITQLSILKKYKRPLGLVMSYPATYVSNKKFVPSLLLSLDDILLPSRFLQFALSAYKPEADVISSLAQGLMSPLETDAGILKEFPTTLIQVSQNDPLRDFGILFAIKLKKLGVNVQLKEHLNVPHGCLNMNSPIFELKKEANNMIEECAQFIL